MTEEYLARGVNNATSKTDIAIVKYDRLAWGHGALRMGKFNFERVTMVGCNLTALIGLPVTRFSVTSKGYRRCRATNPIYGIGAQFLTHQ